MVLYRRMRTLLGDAEPEAAFVERNEEDDATVVVLWALLRNRLIRVIGSGERGWDRPGNRPRATVDATSWSTRDITKIEVTESREYDQDFGPDMEWHSAIDVHFGSDRVSAPHFEIPGNSHERTALEGMVAGIIRSQD